jgi:hypothetical protein
VILNILSQKYPIGLKRVTSAIQKVLIRFSNLKIWVRKKKKKISPFIVFNQTQ